MSSQLSLRQRYLRGKRKSRIALVACLAKARIVGPLPSFIIFGAQRSGTTFLFSLMMQHPQVAAPLVKEVHFFDYQFSRGVDWYRAHFPPRNHQALPGPPATTITGEATPNYLYFPGIPERVHDLLPGVKLIALLRNPVDRAYSQYQLSRRIGVEQLSFEQAITTEPERLGHPIERPCPGEINVDKHHLHHSYLSRGLYARQLQRWMDFFPREQMLILNAERLYTHTDSVLEEVAQFLSLSKWQPEERKDRNEQSYAPMELTTRDYLQDYFRPHNEALYALLGTPYGWDRISAPAETVAS